MNADRIVVDRRPPRHPYKWVMWAIVAVVTIMMVVL